MDETLLDDIYWALLGELIPEAEIPGVPNLFEADSLCSEAYARMRKAYERLCIRLGFDEDYEDLDLDIMVNSLEYIQEILAKEMFRLGMAYQTGSLAGRCSAQ